MTATIEKPEAPAPSRTVKRRLGEVTKLHQAEMRLSRRRLAIGDELSIAELEASTRLLDAALDDQAADDDVLEAPNRLRAEAAALDAAIVEARERRAAAIRAVNEARAAELDRQADKARSDARTRRTRTEKLLAQLSEHEGVAYGPVGRIDEDGKVRIAQHGSGANLVGWSAPSTRSEDMERTADELAERAVQLRAAAPKANGKITGADLDGLLASCEALDVEVLGPTLVDVVAAWSSIEGDVAQAVARAVADGVEHDVEVVAQFAGSTLGVPSWSLTAHKRTVEAETFDELVAKVTAAGGVLDAGQRQRLESRARARLHELHALPPNTADAVASEPVRFELAWAGRDAEAGALRVERRP